MTQLGQAPDEAQNGAFLPKTSVAGSRVNFVNPTTTSISTLTLNATGDASNLDFGGFSVIFDYTENGNTFPWGSIVAWNYSNFYIDDGGTGSPTDLRLWRLGASVAGTSAALRKTMLIDISHIAYYLPVIVNTDSHVDGYFCKNNDSSSHTVRIISTSKYIVTGGMV